MSTLFVVATPIGNLADVSPRALDTLRSVDVILCEDTRVTKKILSHFSIHTPTISYHARNEKIKVDAILRFFEDGKSVALVSDAGTPAISDPGALLVREVRIRFPEVSVVAVPGPSALTAALSVAGMPVSDFLFLGFLPHKKGRETLFREIANSARTVVFYESPHRITKTLDVLATCITEPRTVVVCREISKMFEETVHGTAQYVRDYFQNHPDHVRGEFVVMVSPL